VLSEGGLIVYRTLVVRRNRRIYYMPGFSLVTRQDVILGTRFQFTEASGTRAAA